MREFADLLKEALTGAETVPSDADHAALQAAIAKFERRHVTIRWMAVLMVGFMTALAAWAGIGFFDAPDDASVKTLLLYVAAFLFGLNGIAFGKLWFLMMHDQVAVLRELKRIQLQLLTQRGA